MQPDLAVVAGGGAPRGCGLCKAHVPSREMSPGTYTQWKGSAVRKGSPPSVAAWVGPEGVVRGDISPTEDGHGVLSLTCGI